MPAIPRDRFLDAMSRVAATVNVVTTDGPGGRAGVTVSAMTPVSADGAAPTLLICLHEDSRTTPAIAANRCFCINVLREDQASPVGPLRRPNAAGPGRRQVRRDRAPWRCPRARRGWPIRWLRSTVRWLPGIRSARITFSSAP
jgi:hypothetical protein